MTDQEIIKRLGYAGERWEALAASQKFQATRRVPCTIRCFRVGMAVTLEKGKCWECGKEWTEEELAEWANP